MKKVKQRHDEDFVLGRYPKVRKELPEEYKKIYEKHYKENREGRTKASYLSHRMEYWLHKKVASTANVKCKTLEIGAGTLNQLKFEETGIYDIVEPFEELYKDRADLSKVRNIYEDISYVPINEKYDRIISVASFEHIEDLPDVVKRCTELLNDDGVLSVSIPNEGRFLWKFAYTMTTGKEFKKRYRLNYEILMNHEHVNSADEIEVVLAHYFKDVRCTLFGVNKTFAFYRYYECRKKRD